MIENKSTSRPMTLLGSVLLAGLMGACSSDSSRFNDDPFGNPFQSRTGFDPITTHSAKTAAVNGTNLRGARGVLNQPLPQSSTPIMNTPQISSRVPAATVVAPVTTSSIGNAGAVASANYPALSRAPTVLGASSGWTAVGGTPVTLQQGEGIPQLSSRYGVPASAILAVNGLSSANQARPGQQIMIPAYNAVSGGAPAAAAVLPAAAKASNPLPVASRPMLPAAESDAEKRAATKLAELKKKEVARAKPAATADDDDEEEAPVKAAPKLPQPDALKKAEAVKKAEEARKLVEANKLAEAKKAAELKRAVELKKVAEAKKLAAAKKLETDSELSTSSIPEAKPLPAAKAPLVAKPAEAPTANESDQASNASFRWPAQGRVISGFGTRGAGGGNEGINIAVPEGTPVRAAEGGTVVHADDALKGYGKLVLVRHPSGYVTVYAHNSDLKVRRGESVKRGQVIASSGQSGNVTSPQLHFEVRKGAQPVDPMKYLTSN